VQTITPKNATPDKTHIQYQAVDPKAAHAPADPRKVMRTAGFSVASTDEAPPLENSSGSHIPINNDNGGTKAAIGPEATTRLMP